MKVLEEAKSNLTSWGYLPGDDWPENETIREGMHVEFLFIYKQRRKFPWFVL